MSLITLHRVTLNLGGNLLLDEVDWQIENKQRIALVGRNGAGKSSFLRLLQGDIGADSGQVNRISGLSIHGLAQEVPIEENEPVYHFLVKELGSLGQVLMEFRKLMTEDNPERMALCQQQMDKLQAWDILPKIEMMATCLGVDINASMQQLSGGMKRRALLAAALIVSPNLLLLDEPTNHLDVEAIEWLEAYLRNYHGSVLLVTHDRQFLSQVANTIVEIDRGKLHTYQCDYETFLDRREAACLTEERHNALFDKRLADEETWIRTGIKARRTRNEGRVRALKVLREQYKERRNQIGKVKGFALDTQQSGFMVIEAQNVDYQIADKVLLKDFSLLLTRGDKLGIIGPNGCGKTTLVRLLLGELQANSGRIKQGTTLSVAYFDQLRRQLNEQETVMANVADGADHVLINGKSKHVASYLKDFLFTPDRFNQAVSCLSGGERNRLLLAKLFAKPVNFLVMDEPTNDLDMETLELLEKMLIDFNGTLILISHDRAFIDSVVTSVLVWEGEGKFREYLGGYEDYRQNKKQQQKPQPAKPKLEQAKRSTNRLSYNEQRELARIPQQIEVLEDKIAQAHLKMTASDFYKKDAQTLTQFRKDLEADEKMLAGLYQRWEELEGRQ